MKSKRPLIIGITGAFGSGKSTAADFFELRGFKRIVLSSFLEEEAIKRGVTKITRKILQDIGNEWREKYGTGILAKKARELLIKEEGLAVIDGIRNAGEIDELHNNKNFILLAIIADLKVRFERLRKLKRREQLTWEIFAKLDRRDLGLGQKKTGLHVAECIALADFFIDNNRGRDEFYKKLEKFIKSIEKI